MMSSAHPWDIGGTSLPWLRFSSSDGHYVGSGIECENARFDVIERNIPLSPRNTSRRRSPDEELDTIRLTQPMNTTHDGDLLDPIATCKSFVPLLYRVQGLPTRAVRFEGRAAISDRCLEPWVTLQSDGKKVDCVLNRGGRLYESMARTVDLSKTRRSANA